MTHLELLNLLCKNRELLNYAYLNNGVESVEEKFLEMGLFVKVGNRYLLNQSYLEFVDLVLDRLEYSVVFGDYLKELKELIRYKNFYLKTHKPFYKKRILRLVEDIYKKLYFRDRQIVKRLREMEEEIELDIEVLIQEAKGVLEQLGELIGANAKISQVFRELKELEEFQENIIALEENLYKITTNIENYMAWLETFIIQSKRKRKQNLLLNRVVKDIFQERDFYLEEFLTNNMDKLFLPPSKPKVVTDLNSKWLKPALKHLTLQKPKPIKAKNRLSSPSAQKWDFISVEEIREYLNSQGSEDIFKTLLAKGIEEEEAFRLFLHLLSFKNSVITSEFNEYGIRIVRWEV